MRLVLVFIRQFSFGASLGCFIGGAPLMALGFLFVSFVLWSAT